MRIALCISGQPRTWRQCIDSQFALVAGHEVGVFLHLWQGEDTPDEVAALQTAYRPQAVRVTPRPDYAAQKRRLAERSATMPPFTTFDMVHGVAQALEPAFAPPGFDVVVRLRFDSCFDDHIDRHVTPGAAGALCVPDSWRPADGYNDQVAFGPPGLMRLYAAYANWLPRGLDSYPHPDFRPEKALRHYLDRVMMAPVREVPLRVTLRRAGQEALPFDQLADDPLAYARKAAAWRAYAQAHLPDDLADTLNFSHMAEIPLAMDDALMAQVAAWPEARRHALLAAPWAERVRAVDAYLRDHAGMDGQPLPEGAASGTVALDERLYENIRLLCASLIHRMPRDEPLCPEAVIVYALSLNRLDAVRAGDWLQARGAGAVALLEACLPAVPVLAAALRHGDPFRRAFLPGWRLR